MSAERSESSPWRPSLKTRPVIDSWSPVRGVAGPLFDGRETLSRVGLTHSGYARRGFFELVVVGSLVVGLVLVIDWMIQKSGVRARVVDLLQGGDCRFRVSPPHRGNAKPRSEPVRDDRP
ncbi:MAG: DUF4153 domain-containing protein [Acidimicrobiia bacterium]